MHRYNCMSVCLWRLMQVLSIIGFVSGSAIVCLSFSEGLQVYCAGLYCKALKCLSYGKLWQAILTCISTN